MMRFAALFASLLLGACASMGSNEPDPTERRLMALEAQNQALRADLTEQQRMLSGLSAVGLGGTVATLEEQTRRLRGELEELQFRMNQQDERQRALYVDLDNRLTALEGGASSSAAASTAADNQDQKAYLAAFQSLKSGDYVGAISGFEAFLKDFPASPYAPNAQYWIGESHYVKRDFDKAWDAFSSVITRYPDSGKAPDALLKQGLLRIEQNRRDDARALLNQTIKRYPNSTAAGLAKDRLQQLGG